MVISQIVTVKSQIATVAPCIVVVSSVHVRLGAISKLCLLNKSQQLNYEKKNHKSDIELFNLKFSNSTMFLSPFSSRNNSICQINRLWIVDEIVFKSKTILREAVGNSSTKTPEELEISIKTGGLFAPPGQLTGLKLTEEILRFFSNSFDISNIRN